MGKPVVRSLRGENEARTAHTSEAAATVATAGRQYSRARSISHRAKEPSRPATVTLYQLRRTTPGESTSANRDFPLVPQSPARSLCATPPNVADFLRAPDPTIPPRQSSTIQADIPKSVSPYSLIH